MNLQDHFINVRSILLQRKMKRKQKITKIYGLNNPPLIFHQKVKKGITTLWAFWTKSCQSGGLFLLFSINCYSIVSWT